MSDTSILQEIRERKEQAVAGWQDIRREAEKDMRYVAGDPWDDDDKKQRENRATVAPEEMGQYFNQVINGLMANPRGMKFSPTGNGASEDGATFYQNKARETEYRSNATIAYITAATNAIQRSYGYVRVNTRYASPRSANQEIWIEAMPDPDLVLIDDEAKSPDSSDMQFAFVHSWTEQTEHIRRNKKRLRITNFGDFAATRKSWIQGTKILEAEYWKIDTKLRKLLLVELPAPPQTAGMVPGQMPAPKQLEVFRDELGELPPGFKILRELRDVDYPTVKQYFTNGVEILGDVTEWPGKYIPIVSCYGKVLYVPEGGETKRKILSMTRFGRDPWKSYCYACSQELEILAMIPKAPVQAVAGQLDRYKKDWEEAPHKPKAFLYYDAKTAATGDQVLPPPGRLEYAAGENLQALEMVKEGFRRAIQAAMGSNFLPTQAQRRNEKSGKALDKMEQSAAQGTYHFVHSYEHLIRHVGVIFEDLCDKVYSQMGDVGVMEANGDAQSIRINDPNDPKSISTKGDYLVTVSSGPSSDSERDAAADFTDNVVSNIGTIAQIAGPHAAAQVFAHSIRMRTELGAMGAQLADLIDPPQPGKDGKPIPPEMKALMGQVQHLQQQLRQAEQAIQAKTAEKQVDIQGKKEITAMQIAADADQAGKDREVKLAVAELGAKVERLTLFLEERARLGAALEKAADRQHAAVEGSHDRVHELNQAIVDHTLTKSLAAQAHGHALDAADQGAEHGLVAAAQAADLAPQPEAGA